MRTHDANGISMLFGSFAFGLHCTTELLPKMLLQHTYEQYCVFPFAWCNKELGEDICGHDCSVTVFQNKCTAFYQIVQQ